MADEDPFVGPQTAEPTDPFLGPDPSVERQLSAGREDRAAQLQDPATAADLYRLTKNEVGTQGPEATQAFIESVFNRSKARNQRLQDTINDHNYYPKISFKNVPLHENVDTTEYQDALNNVINGGNISQFATGNASGRVGFAGGPETFKAGGERFGIEGPDLHGGTPPPSDPFVGPGKASEYVPETFNTDEQVGAVKDLEKDHPVFKNAVDAASEVLTGFLPKTPTDYATALFPPVQIYKQARQIIGADNPLDALVSQLPLIGRIPEIAAAERTPPGSKERFEAGFKTIGDILMLASLKKAGGAPEPIGAARPPIASAREIPVQQPAGLAATEIPNPVPGSGKFRATYQIDKELGDRMEGLGAAREAGNLRAEYAVRNLTDELNPAQVEDLGKYLFSERMKNVNPAHPQILSYAEMARIESNPEMAKAIDLYRKEIEPAIENLHKRAGTPEAAMAPQRGKYIPLIPKTEEMLPEAQVPPQQVRSARVSRVTKFAREAKGMAKEYETNLRPVLSQAFSEPNQKALLSEFYKAAKRKGVTDTEKFEDLPPEIANNLNEIIGPKSQASGLLKGVRAVQRGATTAALSANPSEIQNHMRRQFNILVSKPPVGRGLLARLEFMLPYIGPKTGAFIRTLTDNMDTPLNRGVLQDVFNSGGGSSRSFGNLYELRSGFAKWTGLKWLQKKTHNLLFGIPKGHGIQGWDLRMRVQLEKIRRAAEPDLANDPQRMREFANQIGQYGAHPDWLIGAMREINPYAATTLPMRLTELKTAVGVSGLKSKSIGMKLLRNAETQLRGTGGTILGLVAVNKFLSGRYPWENDPGHEFDLNTGLTGKDGKRMYLKFRVIAPELSRPVSTVGLPGLGREKTAKHPQYLSAIGTALANQGLSLIAGPAQGALLTALTGKVPYLVKSPGNAPELMDVAKLSKEDIRAGKSRGLEQVKRAVAGLNPLGESIVQPRYEPELTPALKSIERPVFGLRSVRPLGSMFSESYEKKRGKAPRSLGEMRAKEIRAMKRRMKEG